MTTITELKSIQQSINEQISQMQNKLQDLNAKGIFLAGRIAERENIETTQEEEPRANELRSSTTTEN